MGEKILFGLACVSHRLAMKFFLAVPILQFLKLVKESKVNCCLFSVVVGLGYRIYTVACMFHGTYAVKPTQLIVSQLFFTQRPFP